MGSNINVGLVYDSSRAIGTHLENLIELLNENRGHIVYVKFCEDSDGERWIQQNSPNIDTTILEKLTQSYYGQINLLIDLFQLKDLNVEIKIEKSEEFFGLLLSFREDDILSDYLKESLDTITDRILKFVAEIYPILQFDYAFCDHEAEIEFSPKEFNAERYSLSFLPDLSTGKLNVLKSNWHINGLTER